MMDSTPDSIPSLAELSHTSTIADDVARVLFLTPEHEGTEVALGYNRSQSGEDDEKEFGSDISIASEGDRTFVNFEHSKHPAGQLKSLLNSEVEVQNTYGIEIFQNPCYGAMSLSRKELAAIFNVFDASQQNESLTSKSVASNFSDSGKDAVTEITSNTSNVDHSTIIWERKIDSLERECATLKEIIKADSATILRLKTELSEMQTAESIRPSKIRSEFDASSVKRERDDLLKRELHYLETIKTLEQGIINKTKAKNSNETRKELDQLRLENDLFASQIVENETELQKTRAVATQLEAENAKLKRALPPPQQNESLQSNDKPRDGKIADEISSDRLLMAQVASLAARIALIENEIERIDSENRETDTFLNPTDIRIPLEMSQVERGKFHPRSSGMQQFAEADEIEVTIEGLIVTSSGIPDKQHDLNISLPPNTPTSPNPCCSFCDCFPTASVEEV